VFDLGPLAIGLMLLYAAFVIAIVVLVVLAMIALVLSIRLLRIRLAEAAPSANPGEGMAPSGR
jgi:membrane protein implicated in regulation of membrane protease activity